MRDNWEECLFEGETSLITKGTTPTSLGKEFKESGINFIKAESITNSGKFIPESFAFIDEETHAILRRSQLQVDDILFSIAGVLGRIAVVDKTIIPANTNQALALIRLSNSSILDRDYIKYYLNGAFIKDQIRRINVQAAQANFSLGDIGRLNIQYPPLPQQKKIAKILSTVDAVIEKTESAIAKYQAIKQGLMHDLFELRTDDYWVFYELGEIANIIDPHPSHRAPSIDDRGIPFVGIGDIDESGNLIKNARKVSEKIFDEHSMRYKLSNKTIGFGRVATIGKIIRFKNYDFKFTISPTMAIINPTKIESDYLSFALDSDYMKTQIDKLLTGSTRSSLGIELLRKLIVKVPVDVDEKIKISKALNSIVQKIDLEKQVLTKYQQLKAGLLQDLLTGKVAVSVD
ncbi:restriction endonuclease subunit S [Formosa algae]|uniref:Type I restriction enzyme S subunit n=1 Tax=Formosa algae TaxID=225843 RepID=A0A9X1C8K5_9FLAO|nr:restriction endonuclease subunit S [Formosa algae]MBP1839416.1 type I restriction enzyme S subunit [Formosa algae]MDQ0334720.1 type I restriction enzyme S subunit [Formosa algae]OEI81972.1 hypothetical protein AST99_00565 [Formosa algae]